MCGRWKRSHGEQKTVVQEIFSTNNTSIGDIPTVGAFTSIDVVSHVGSALGVPLSVICVGDAAVGGTNAAVA